MFTPVFTRLLTPLEYGIYSHYVSLLGIFTVLVSFEISGNAMYRGMAKFNTGEAKCYVSASLGALGALYTSSALIALLFSPTLTRLTSLGLGLTLILISQVFLNSVEGIYLAKARYEGRYKAATLVNAIAGITTPLLSLLLIYRGLGGYARIISPLLTSGAIAAFATAKILKESKKIYDKAAWRFIFGATAPLLPYYLSLSLIAQGDKLLLSYTYGKEWLGMYSAAYSLGLTLSLITGGGMLALAPWFARKLSEKKEGSIREVCELCARLVGMLTLAFLCLVPELYSLFAPGEYSPALPVVYIISLSVFFSFLCAMHTSLFQHYGKSLAATRSSILSAAVGIGVGYIAQSIIDWRMAALLPLFAHGTLFLLISGSLNRASGKRLVNVNNYLQIAIYLIPASVVIFWLKASPVSRILLFLAFIMLIIGEVFRGREFIFLTGKKTDKATG